MVDMSICYEKKCPTKFICERFIAFHDHHLTEHWQSVVGFVKDPETGKCQNFLPKSDDSYLT